MVVVVEGCCCTTDRQLYKTSFVLSFRLQLLLNLRVTAHHADLVQVGDEALQEAHRLAAGLRRPHHLHHLHRRLGVEE